jgi:uncharacterized protein YceK
MISEKINKIILLFVFLLLSGCGNVKSETVIINVIGNSQANQNLKEFLLSKNMQISTQGTVKVSIIDFAIAKGFNIRNKNNIIVKQNYFIKVHYTIEKNDLLSNYKEQFSITIPVDSDVFDNDIYTLDLAKTNLYARAFNMIYTKINLA